MNLLVIGSLSVLDEQKGVNTLDYVTSLSDGKRKGLLEVDTSVYTNNPEDIIVWETKVKEISKRKIFGIKDCRMKHYHPFLS